MDAINEHELIDSIRNQALKAIRIQQTEDGYFRVIANIQRVSLGNVWKEGGLVLITTRKSPREWRDLDRLTRHIKDKWGNVPQLNLSLNFEPKEK